jgi:hypothetical protein
MERVGGTGVPVEYLKGGRARLWCTPSPPAMRAAIVIESHGQWLLATVTRIEAVKAAAIGDCNCDQVTHALATSDYNRCKVSQAAAISGYISCSDYNRYKITWAVAMSDCNHYKVTHAVALSVTLKAIKPQRLQLSLTIILVRSSTL